MQLKHVLIQQLLQAVTKQPARYVCFTQHCSLHRRLPAHIKNFRNNLQMAPFTILSLQKCPLQINNSGEKINTFVVASWQSQNIQKTKPNMKTTSIAKRKQRKHVIMWVHQCSHKWFYSQTPDNNLQQEAL
jgi:hypothetical protein